MAQGGETTAMSGHQGVKEPERPCGREFVAWIRDAIHEVERIDAEAGYPLPGDSALAIRLTTIDEAIDLWLNA